MKAHPPVISRVLRAAGFMVTATRMRQGMLVTRRLPLGGVAGPPTAWVTATFDDDERALRFASEAKRVLEERGFTVSQSGATLMVRGD